MRTPASIQVPIKYFTASDFLHLIIEFGIENEYFKICRIMLNVVENIMSLTFLLSLKTTPSAGVDRKYIELSGLGA